MAVKKSIAGTRTKEALILLFYARFWRRRRHPAASAICRQEFVRNRFAPVKEGIQYLKT